MATENLNFSAAVDDWAKESADRLERIWKASSQELGSIASNGVPIDLGFAQSSIQASTESMPLIDPAAQNKEKTARSFDIGQISAVIASAKLGGTIYIGWVAAYILALEYGHSKQAPQGFARLAAAQWEIIVSQAVAEAKSRAV